VIETEEKLGGSRLAPGESFSFACHCGLACFNTCCANKRLPLYPYDLLRLRRGLGLTSAEVLARLATLEEDPASGWPALRLTLTGEGRCPLLGPAGCTVYAHRPAACRTYPLARAAAPGADGGPAREVFLRQESPACLGWQEARALSVEQWVDEQGLAPYQEANDRLLGLFLHPRRKGRVTLTQAQTHAVILALYNIDVFRQWAQTPGAAGRLGVDPASLGAVLADDEELLALGQEWLTRELFGPAARAAQNIGKGKKGKGKSKARRR
jgi:Fe-S-cluster containining protein